MTLTELFTSVADAIRGRNPSAPEKIKAKNFAQEIEGACREAEVVGFNVGLYQGRDEGRQEQYDAFWDGFQDYGNRPQYTYAFWGWYDGAYNPKYPIVCQKNWSTVDTFRASYITYTLVDIELVDNNNAGVMFYDCYKLVTIKKLKLTPTAKLSTLAFQNCRNLKNITIDGEIGVTLDFRWSTLLTVESLRSILTALSKDSTYATDKVLTLAAASRAAVEADYECLSELASAVTAGWAISYI